MTSRFSSWIRDNVLGLIAIYLALGGVAFAAAEPNSVVSESIVDGEVKTNDIGVGQVNGAHVSSSSVATSELVDDSILGLDIKNETVTTNDLGANSVFSPDIATDAVRGEELAANSVSSGEVIFNSLTSSDLGESSVGASEVADNSLTGVDVAETSLSTNVLQRRVTSTCPSGQAISAVGSSGGVNCSPGPRVYFGYRNGSQPICNDGCVEGTLNLPAGSYLVSGSILANGNDGFGGPEIYSVHCQINSPVGPIAVSQQTDRPDGADPYDQTRTVDLIGAVTLGSDGALSLFCRDFEGDEFIDYDELFGSHVRLTAVRVGALTVTQFE